MTPDIIVKVSGPKTTVVSSPTGSATKLTELADVVSTPLADGEVLTYVAANGRFEFEAQASATSIDQFARDRANGAFVEANTADALANTANTTGQSAFNKANSANTLAQTAYDRGNTAWTLANTANITGQAAFAKANSLITGVSSVAGKTGAVTLSTSDITENVSSNLWFTASRVRSNISNTTPINYDATTGVVSHAESGAVATTYGNTTFVPTITLDSKGHITSVTNTAIALPPSTDEYARAHANGAFDKANTANVTAQSAFDKANGSVQSVAGRTGAVTLDTYDVTENTAGPFYFTSSRVRSNISNTAPINYDPSTGIISHTDSGVVANTYGNTTYVPVLSVDAKGHVTGVVNTAISFPASLDQYARDTANGAFTQANTANTTGQAAFDTANSGYNLATTANTIATSSYNQANIATTNADAAFVKANSAWTLANTANTTGQAAFDKANSLVTGVSSVAGKTGSVTLDTYDVTENSAGPYYFTAAKVRSNISNTTPINYDASTGTISHADSGAVATTYGNTTFVPTITVDAKGHITAVSNTAIALPPSTDEFARAHANGAFDQANSAWTLANTANTVAASSYAQANIATSNADAAFTRANTANVTGQAAFDKANSLVTGVSSVAGKTGAVTLDTYDVTENLSSNLWFTAARVRSNISNTTPINYEPGTGIISHADSGAVASGYGDAATVPKVVVDAQGHVTSVTNTSIGISASQVTSGTLSIARGGTGQTAITVNGSLLIGNTVSGGYDVNALTQGTGIVITNDKGSITIAATGGSAIDQYARDKANGAAQTGFPTINVATPGQANVVASTNNDTLIIAPGTGITLTTDAATKTVTITATGGSATDQFARDHSNGAFDQANASYTLANTANTVAASAYNQANIATTNADAAFTQANSAWTLANTANTTGQAAFDKANGAIYTAAQIRVNISNTTPINYDSSTGDISHADSGAVATTYGNTTFVPTITVDAKGHVTSIVNTAIALPPSTDEFARAHANGAFDQANSAWTLANTANTTAQAGFNQANTANITGQAAFDKANSLVTGVSSVAGKTGAVVLDTYDIAENLSSNLWFTAARVRSNISNTTPINYEPSTGVISHADSGVAASGYGDATTVPKVVVDAKGHVTSITNTTIGIAASQVTSGTLSVSRGGTGQSAITVNGSLLIGNTVSGGYDVNALTQGTGILITNDKGSITIAATGGSAIDQFARDHSNGAFDQANTANVTGQAAFDKANGAIYTAAQIRANISNTAPINYDATTGIVSHAASGVSASGYGSATQVPVLVVDANGHITSVTNTAISVSAGSNTAAPGAIQFNNGGVLGGSANLVWDNANGSMMIGYGPIEAPLTVRSNATTTLPYGFESIVTIDDASPGDVRGTYAASVSRRTTGNTALSIGCSADAFLRGNGNVTQLSSFEGYAEIDGGLGIATHAAPFHAYPVYSPSPTQLINAYGFKSDAQTMGANNYAFWTDQSSGANTYAVYAGGNANSYFGGPVGIGDTPWSTLTVAETLRTNTAAFHYNTHVNGTIDPGVDVSLDTYCGLGVEIANYANSGISFNQVYGSGSWVYHASPLAITTLFAMSVGNIRNYWSYGGPYGTVLYSIALDVSGYNYPEVVNNIGIRIQDITGGTNNYAIKYEGTVPFALMGSGRVGIGTTSPDNALEVQVTDAATTTTTYPLKISHLTTGTAGDAFAVGLEFELENPSGTPEVVAKIAIERWLENGNTSGAVMYYQLAGGTMVSPLDGYAWQPNAGIAGDYSGTFEVSSITDSTWAAPLITLFKARGVYGTPAIVQNGDLLGTIEMAGWDGAGQARRGARIQAIVDGTPGAADMPTALLFNTTSDGAASPNEKMRIRANGQIHMGSLSAADTESPLVIEANVTSTTTPARMISGTYANTIVSPTVDQNVAYPYHTHSGMHSYITVPATCTTNVGGLLGVYGQARHHGSKECTYITGVSGYGYNVGSANVRGAGLDSAVAGVSATGETLGGLVDAVIGVDAGCYVSGGTVTNLYGIRIPDLYIGGGSVTNRYGIWMGTPTGSATNDYGIYQEGTQKNYFGGPVSIGPPTYDGALSVSQTLSTNTTSHWLSSILGVIDPAVDVTIDGYWGSSIEVENRANTNIGAMNIWGGYVSVYQFSPLATASMSSFTVGNNRGYGYGGPYGTVSDSIGLDVYGYNYPEVVNNIGIRILDITGGTNNYAIKYEGTVPFALMGSGRVGIGTQNPATDLEINRNVDGEVSLYVNNANTGTSAATYVQVGSAITGQKYGYLAHTGTGFSAPGTLYTANTTLLMGADLLGLTLIAYSPTGNLIFATGGDTTTNERMRIGANGQIHMGSATVADTESPLVIESNVTSNVVGSTPGVYIRALLAPTTDQSTTYDVQTVGANSIVVIPPTSTTDIGTVFGLQGTVTHHGTGQWHDMFGLSATAYNAQANGNYICAGAGLYSQSDNGTVPALAALDLWAGAYGGTIGTQVGVQILLDNAGGTITNRYGIWIGTPSGSATNDYGIYQQGAQKNYFGGPIGIGTTSPGDSLDIKNMLTMGASLDPTYGPSAAISVPQYPGQATTGYLSLTASNNYLETAGIDIYGSKSNVASANGTIALWRTGYIYTMFLDERGMISCNGALGRNNPVTKTSDFALGNTENWIIHNKSGSTCTVTLPAASQWAGREVMLHSTQPQALVSASSDVVPITGGAAGTAILPAIAGHWATLVSDTVNWVITERGRSGGTLSVAEGGTGQTAITVNGSLLIGNTVSGGYDVNALTQGSGILITNDKGSITIASTASGGNGYGVLVVSGQSDIVSDQANDTLTIVAGTGMTITTNAGTDTITLSAADAFASAQANAAFNAANTAANTTQGLHAIWVPAWAMYPQITNGASAANGAFEVVPYRQVLKTLDYDATTQESAQFTIKMPRSYNLGTVTANAVWSHGTTATNFGVTWLFDAYAYSDGDLIDGAFGTAVPTTDTGGTANTCYISPPTSAITIGGTPAAGDWVIFRVARQVANTGDTMAIDARLHGVEIMITTNANTDA
jgi:hypothetical protein